MLNETQKKLFHISKIIMAVMCTFLIIGLFLQMVCMLWVCLMPDKLAHFFEAFPIWRPFVSNMYLFSQATAELCGSMLSYAFAIYFTKTACDIFSMLEKGEALPICKIRRLSIGAIVGAVLVPLVKNVAFGIFVESNYVKYTLDVGLFSFGIALFAISYSFIKGKDNRGN